MAWQQQISKRIRYYIIHTISMCIAIVFMHEASNQKTIVKPEREI